MKIGALETVALAALAVMLGKQMLRRIPVLARLNIPAAIAGGLVFAIAHLALRSTGAAALEFDTALRDPLMLTCFAIIGFNASFRVLWRGGAMIAILLLLATAGGAVQNLVGVLAALAFGLNPLIGPLAGSVSLTGGPATSQAFGATFEQMGVPGAATIALASATFGIAVSGLVAGALGGWLTRGRASGSAEVAVGAPTPEPVRDLARHALWIALSLGAGAVFSRGISAAGFVMPGYIGAMIVAAVVRNADDRWRFACFSESTFGAIFSAVLPLIIANAMVTLRLWELEKLALPLLAILCVQVVVTVAWCGASYWVLGRDYEAAVTVAGFCGFMLGITPNAMASMEEVAAKHGPAPRAFLAVPVVGGFLIDFTNSLLITGSAWLIKSIFNAG